MKRKAAAKKDHDPVCSGGPLEHFLKVRARTEQLAAPIRADHMDLQTMPDVSPAKWHLAHTTWFFETFILKAFDPAYKVFDEKFNYLFNSYYEAVGERHPRPERGQIKDPDASRVLEYRAYVTEKTARLAENRPGPDILRLLELGCHHEEQHQELLLTDIKHVLYFACDKTPYNPEGDGPAGEGAALSWQTIPGAIYEIGHAGGGFSFDCEGPRHKVFLEDFQVASRPVSAGEYLEFITEGGYQKVDLWLSDGWAWVQAGKRTCPLYWEEDDGAWQAFTMRGMTPVDPAAPVCHLSYYEAEAFARWAGMRLPTEAEHETWARANNLTEAGEVWEWTGSAYLPYPGFKASRDAVGEYNGKFMCNQMVLRGGSGATPPGHWRPTYRNFFYPFQQWQFSGVRLVKDVK